MLKPDQTKKYLERFIKFDSNLDKNWFIEKLDKSIFWYENKDHDKIFGETNKLLTFNKTTNSIYKNFSDTMSDEFIQSINSLKCPCYIIFQNYSILINDKPTFLEFIKNYRFGLTEFYIVDKSNNSISINHELCYCRSY